MGFRNQFLYENFNDCYNKAIRAKNEGDMLSAKENFYQASSYMLQLAEISEGMDKEEKKQKGLRLKKIADSIDVSRYKKPEVHTYSRPASSSQSNIRPSIMSHGQETEVPSDLQQFFSFYDAKDIKETFDSVIGLEQAKASITEYVINPIKYSNAYNYNFIDNKAILLEGPPGTGKTTFAKAVAKEIEQPFALINVAQLVNCYVGETAKNIDKVFNFLREYAEKNNCGITIFMDEFDEIAKKRDGDDKTAMTAVPALLRNMDGVKSSKAFLILANTNFKDQLDTAILSRFRKQIYIPLPDKKARLHLFKSKLNDIEEEYLEKIDFNKIADMSNGLSGRDITFICDDFKYQLARLKAGLDKDLDFHRVMESLVEEKLSTKN